MKALKKSFFIILMIFSLGVFASCDGYANVALEDGGSVSFSFFRCSWKWVSGDDGGGRPGSCY